MTDRTKPEDPQEKTPTELAAESRWAHVLTEEELAKEPGSFVAFLPSPKPETRASDAQQIEKMRAMYSNIIYWPGLNGDD
jgi:hypothetical protein